MESFVLLLQEVFPIEEEKASLMSCPFAEILGSSEVCSQSVLPGALEPDPVQ